MDRRNFFKVLSTASAGLMTGACGKKLDNYIPLLVSDQEIVPGQEQWHPGVCGECDAGCGVIVRVMTGERVIERDGKQLRQQIATVKKIEGNPLDSVSGGRLCARGQAGVQGLYNPDRLRGPMRRQGQKGRPEFAPTTWDEAIAVAAEKLGRVKQSDAARIAFLTGPQPGTRALAIARFLEALGAPPAITFGLTDFPLERKAAQQVHGWNGLPVYDLGNARYALGIGADFLGGWASPVYYSRQFGHFRQGREGIRGRLVQAETRLSIAGQSADEWAPLRPGTELAFALAIGHLLLSEKLARQPEALPASILQAFQAADPAAAAKACGLDEKRLRRLAHELGQSDAPLVIPGASVPHTNSLAALVAAGSLNLLLGNAGKPGGVHAPAPEPTESRPAFANFAQRLENARFVFLDDTNPVYTLPGATGIADKLAKVETTVSFAPFLNDSAAYADLLLPDHHSLESAAAVVPNVARGAAVVVATPFVQPLYETRATEQVLADLAKKMDFSFEAATPKSVVQGMLPAGQSWDDVVAQGGFWAMPAADSAAPQKPAANRATRAAARNQTEAALDTAPATFSGDASQYPFYFQPYLSLQFQDGRGANLPWLQELPDPVSSSMWGLPVEIDTKTAAKMGIRNGDMVRVESAHGRIDAPAYVDPAAMPGVVSMPIGAGHQNYGRYAGRGANPLAIVAPVWEASTGALALGATRVRLTKLGPEKQLIQFAANDREEGPWGYR